MEEFTDEFLQGIMAGITHDPDRPLGEIAAQALEAGAMGAVLGGVTTGAQSAWGPGNSLSPETRAQVIKMRQIAGTFLTLPLGRSRIEGGRG